MARCVEADGLHCYSNHGTFYYNQLAALKLLLGDTDGARNVTQTYFNTLYLNQIDANGEQARSSSVARKQLLTDHTAP